MYQSNAPISLWLQSPPENVTNPQCPGVLDLALDARCSFQLCEVSGSLQFPTGCVFQDAQELGTLPQSLVVYAQSGE